MKFFRKCAMTASVLCAAGSASAQYYPYAAPATLPAPTVESRPMWQYNQVPGYPTSYQETEVVPTPNAMPAPVNSGAGSYYSNGAINNENAWNSPGPGNCTNCAPEPAYGCDTCAPACCGPSWFGGIAALYMERNKPDSYQMSFDTTNPIGELILNRDTVGDWQWGFEARVGKYFCCNSAVELTFWTLEELDMQATAIDPNGPGALPNINTPFDFRSLNFGAGRPVNDAFDTAQAHRVERTNQVYNLEINFINYPMFGNPGCGLQASWLAGFRYFRFEEDFLFASSAGSPNFGVDPANEAYYSIDVDNNLFGLQLGGRADYYFSPRISLYASPRFGAYINHVTHESTIASGDGVYALRIESDKDIISLLGQLDVGVNVNITCHISAYAGYRVVAVSGVGLSDRQIPYLQDDLYGIADVDTNSNLVLHGLVAGVQFTY